MIQRLKESRDPVMEAILHETEHMLARGRMSLPLSLCFAVVRGDDLLLQQLLRSGSDPNEQDNNGRTALVCNTPPLFFTTMSIYTGIFYMLFDHQFVSPQQHIAASNGSDRCVVQLLEHGVDPNITGIICSY